MPVICFAGKTDILNLDLCFELANVYVLLPWKSNLLRPAEDEFGNIITQPLLYATLNQFLSVLLSDLWHIFDKNDAVEIDSFIE